MWSKIGMGGESLQTRSPLFHALNDRQITEALLKQQKKVTLSQNVSTEVCTFATMVNVTKKTNDATRSSDTTLNSNDITCSDDTTLNSNDATRSGDTTSNYNDATRFGDTSFVLYNLYVSETHTALQL